MKIVNNNYDLELRFIFSMLMGLTVLLLLWLLCGCRQMPVLAGTYQEDKVAQAKVDSQQSDRIADVSLVSEAALVVLEDVAPENPVVQVAHKQATATRGKADIEAAKNRDRASLEERKLETLNVSPGPMDFIGRAMAGDWMGLMDLVLGAMGLGGAAYGVRSRMKSRQVVAEVVDGVERYKAEDPEGSEKLKDCLSKAMDRRTKEIVKKVRKA